MNLDLNIPEPPPGPPRKHKPTPATCTSWHSPTSKRNQAKPNCRTPCTKSRTTVQTTPHTKQHLDRVAPKSRMASYRLIGSFAKSCAKFPGGDLLIGSFAKSCTEFPFSMSGIWRLIVYAEFAGCSVRYQCCVFAARCSGADMRCRAA